jgi:hypothetical protein
MIELSASASVLTYLHCLAVATDDDKGDASSSLLLLLLLLIASTVVFKDDGLYSLRCRRCRRRQVSELTSCSPGSSRVGSN